MSYSLRSRPLSPISSVFEDNAQVVFDFSNISDAVPDRRALQINKHYLWSKYMHELQMMDK